MQLTIFYFMNILKIRKRNFRFSLFTLVDSVERGMYYVYVT